VSLDKGLGGLCTELSTALVDSSGEPVDNPSLEAGVAIGGDTVVAQSGVTRQGEGHLHESLAANPDLDDAVALLDLGQGIEALNQLAEEGVPAIQVGGCSVGHEELASTAIGI
jgi:hypothetical protein